MLLSAAFNALTRTQHVKMVAKVGIGACRAVWVLGQDLAMLHLMRNCGKGFWSLHCTLGEGGGALQFVPEIKV